MLHPSDFEGVDRADSVLRAANPAEQELFPSIDDWRSRGVRVVLMSKAASIGVNGLHFIEDLILWSPPSGSLEQLFGRFLRLALR